MKPKLKSYSRGKLGMPSFADTLALFDKQAISEYPLRFLGSGYKDLYMMEEERDGNFHIVGTSGHGKSKYIEYHARKDIDMGFGLCLIDPSDRGATFRSVLEYCASINHQKVCIIDPATLYDYGKIACIKALNSRYPTKSVRAVQDAINILFGMSLSTTPRIQDNLKALLRMLAKGDMTLHESAYFTEYNKERDKWESIINHKKGVDSEIIRDKFVTAATWKNEFSTTITKLNIFRSEPLSLMIGSTIGIDFDKMIDEGWVILCNLYPTHIDRETSDFLGILIISQLNQAIENLNDRPEGFGEHGRRFYLYIDEAGRFATPQIENILSYNRKSGFNLIFAHHYPGQIKNSDVWDAIRTNTTVKIMFHMADPKDRLDMIKMLSFDDPQAANQKYQNLPKRKFLIKKGKEHPIELESPTVHPPVFYRNKSQVVEQYIRERLEDEWYLNKGEIEDQIKARVKNDIERTNFIPPIERATPDGKANSNPSKTRPSSLFDLGAEAEQFIRDNPPPKPHVSHDKDSKK